MKNAKRVLACLLAVGMVIGLFPLSSMAADTGSYAEHWAGHAIERWLEYGVVSETGDGAFQPDTSITRGEVAKMIATMLRLEILGENIFEDLEDDAWYTPYILMCYAAGIMVGDGAGHVRPNAPITRQEACKVLVVALGLTSAESTRTSFADDTSIDAWAVTYVETLRAAGYIQGVGEGIFAPLDFITGASALTILDNAVAAYIAEPGTYSGTYDGIVIVACDEVIIENSTIDGTLIVTGPHDESGTGISIEKSAIHGNVMVIGSARTDGTGRDITIEDSTVSGDVLVTEEAAKSDIKLVDTVVEGTISAPAGTVTDTAKTEDKGSSFLPSSPDLTRIGITAIPSIGALEVGADTSVTVETSPSEAAITAASNDTAVATVSALGHVLTITGVAEGTATITVSASLSGYSSNTASFPVTVTDSSVQTVLIGTIADVADLEAGDTVTRAVVTTPADAAVTAVSGTPGIATVSVTGHTLTVTGVAEGTAAITVTAAKDGYTSGTATFDVEVIPVETPPDPDPGEITIGALSDITGLKKGGTQQVTVHTNPDTAAVTAVSGTPGVATVTAGGTNGHTLTVTGIAAGTATITVTARLADHTDEVITFTVSVTDEWVNTVTIGAIANIAELEANATKQVSVSTTPADAQVTATSGDTAIATVTAGGTNGHTLTVTGVAAGTATITVNAAKSEHNDAQSVTFTVTVVVPEVPQRATFNFNSDWSFSKGMGKNNSGSTLSSETVTVLSSSETPYAVDYDTSGANWSTVSLPHTYNDEDTFDNFMESGHNGERSMYTGTAWYKKTFTIPSLYAGKRVFIEFEAARQAADVYINGVKLEGRSENGFIPFGYDITDYITIGAENDITVMVDNTFPYLSYNENCTESGCTTAVCQGHQLSWHDSHWHPTDGGLYRNVYLHITDPLHVTLPLYSFLETQGVYVYTTDETDSSATVNVESEVINQYEEAKTFTYTVEVFDMDGTKVAGPLTSTQTLAAGEKSSYTLSGTISNPTRWSDAYPYLYTVQVSITVDDEVLDTTTTDLGIRTYRFTSDQGFFANGNYTKLQGWGQKSTNEWAGLGSAYPDWMQDHVIKLMKDAGGNFIRWGHTAGSPTQIGISDKYGLFVEQPGVDGEGSTVGGVYSNTAYAVRADAFRDMIIYHRNSPSIIMWELGNQSMPNSEAAMLRAMIEEYDHHGSAPGQSAQRANSGTWADTEESSQRGVAVRRGDSVMVNYVNVAISTEGSGDMSTASLGKKPSVEGEYNREEARRGVWDRYTPGFETYKTASGSTYNLTTEQFAANQVKEYAKIAKVAHNGGANWVFSDSTSHGRVFSEVTRASGEVDAVMLPKEAYYAIKTIFTDEPDTYIIGHWNYPVGTTKAVYVASNANSVELFLNDSSLGMGTKSNNYLFTFSNITWAEGELKAVGYAADGTTVLSQSVKKTHGEPAALKMTPIVGPQGLLANGSDILLIDVEVVDAEGNRCLTFDGTVNGKKTTFTINDENGSSIWRGGYNSGLEGSTNQKELFIEAGITRVAVRTTMTPGEITVTAATAGLTSDTISIESIAVENTGGLNPALSQTPAYDLSLLTDPGVGEGEKSGNQSGGGGTATYKSALVEGMGYTGTSPAALATPAIEGKQVYTDDTNIKFGALPIYLLNSDYLQFPSADSVNTAVDLLVFSTIKKVNIYVAHAVDVPKPTWLTSAPQSGEPFVDTGDTIVIDGVSYDVYVSTAEAGISYTIGSNVDDGLDGVDKRMYVMFFKEYGSEEDFFSDDFNDQTLDSVPLGWYSSELKEGDFAPGGVANARVREETPGGNKVLEIYDTAITNTDPSSQNFTVIYNEFLPLSGKFSVEFKFYDYDLKVNSTPQNNVAIFLTDDAPSLNNANEHGPTVVESYIMSGTRLAGRELAAAAANYTYVPMDTALAAKTWYTVRYVVDMSIQRYSISVYDAAGTTLLGSLPSVQFRQPKSSVNHLMIRSGGATGTRILFDDIKVELIDDALAGIAVDGIPLGDFAASKQSYEHLLAPGTTTIPTVTATTRDQYATVSVEQADEVEGTATITVTPLHGGSSATYTVNFTVAEAQEVTGITFNGKAYAAFDKETLSYSIVLPPAMLPSEMTVGAITNYGSATVTQAAALPGSATVAIDGTTYTINFTLAEYELFDDFSGTLSKWSGEPGIGEISIVTDGEKGTVLQLTDPNGTGDSPARMTRLHGALETIYDTDSLKGKKIVLEYDIKIAANTQTFVRGLLSNGTDLTSATVDGKYDLPVELYLSRVNTGTVEYRTKGITTTNYSLSPSLSIKYSEWNSVRIEVMTEDEIRTDGVFRVTITNSGGTTSGTSTESTAVAKNITSAGEKVTAVNSGDKTQFSFVQLATGNGGYGTVWFDNVRVYVCDDI